MNDNKKTLLHAFDKFISFCDKHDLTWWADGGTLLGVIRDGKMIEWDDDIDIMMPRTDFDKLSSLMHAYPRSIGKGLFFQDPITDPEYMNIHARLRIDNTLNASNRESHIHSHKGIFIDIYPLDYCYDIDEQNEAVADEIRTLVKMSDCEKDEPSKTKQQKPRHAYVALHEILRKMNFDAISKMSMHYAIYGCYYDTCIFPACFWRYSKYKGMTLFASYFAKTFKMKMKGLHHKVNVPNGYDSILKLWYGKDYMTPKQESSFHNS